MSKYVIVDLEMCRVPKGVRSDEFNLGSEIIEIGAVLLDEAYGELDSFKSFVMPQYGELDSYIHRLTGITQKDLENAPPIKEALEAFVGWLPEDAVVVSWSENDENQIRRETEVKGIDIPGLGEYLDTWEDCQKTFAEKMNSTKAYRLSEALIITAIEFDEHLHDALVDARNTALLFAKMKREKKLELIYCYMTEDDASSGTCASGLLGNCRYAV